jgi:energy-converting hydrogenase Eha subunit A
MTRNFRREGPSLLRLRRLLSVPLTPLVLAGAAFEPIAIFALPVMFFGHEAGWVRLVGIVGAMLTSACGVLATLACAADVRRGWRQR